MKPSEALAIHRAALRRLLNRHGFAHPRVFGSVLTGTDTEESDLDLLVDTTSETTLLDIAKIQNHLQNLLGVRVNVLTPKALSPRYRERVLSEAKRI